MQKLINRHVQLITNWTSTTNFFCGILQLSDAGDNFIKLIPWDEAYQQNHLPWVPVQGEFHIHTEDIRGIVDIDTINEKAIKEYGQSYGGFGNTERPNYSN